jgi:hypothetical protein
MKPTPESCLADLILRSGWFTQSLNAIELGTYPSMSSLHDRVVGTGTISAMIVCSGMDKPLRVGVGKGCKERGLQRSVAALGTSIAEA